MDVQWGLIWVTMKSIWGNDGNGKKGTQTIDGQWNLVWVTMGSTWGQEGGRGMMEMAK
jgi:hypothetical protein